MRFIVFCFMVLSAFPLACATTPPFVWVGNLPTQGRQAEQPKVIRAGDKVSVVVRGQDQLNLTYDVLEDGSLVIPLIGPVPVAGLTTQQAAARVTSHLARVIVKPEVSVLLAATATFQISVLGEVRTPGRFMLKVGDGVLAGIATAGGLTDFADTDAIYVLRDKSAPQRIRFRYRDLTAGDIASNGFALREGDTVIVE